MKFILGILCIILAIAGGIFTGIVFLGIGIWELVENFQNDTLSLWIIIKALFFIALRSVVGCIVAAIFYFLGLNLLKR